MSPFALLGPPPPSPHPWPLSHCCLCLWVMHICSLANPFAFFHPFPLPLPSDGYLYFIYLFSCWRTFRFHTSIPSPPRVFAHTKNTRDVGTRVFIHQIDESCHVHSGICLPAHTWESFPRAICPTELVAGKEFILFICLTCYQIIYLMSS